MVLPLLMLASYGLQAYGADKNKQASAAAQAKLDASNRINGTAQAAQDAQIEAYLRQIQGQYSNDLSGLIDKFQPGARTGVYDTGAAQSQDGLRQVLGVVNGQNSPYVQGAPGLFANAQTSAAARANQLNAPGIDAASMAGGLNAMAQRDSRNAYDFSDNAAVTNSKIQDAMRLYQLSNAHRNQALARAGMQNQLDQQHAQNAGASYMLAGGLLGAAAQGYGAYSAAQPSAADPGGYSNSTTPSDRPQGPSQY